MSDKSTETDNMSLDDLQTYRHFLQLFVQQQEMVNQIQRYLAFKYQLKSMEQLNIESGDITRI